MISYYLLMTLVLTLGSAAVLPNNSSNTVDLELKGFDHRIVGGHTVNITRHPHQVSLRRKGCPTCTYQHICGGSIYSKNVIITAAHCIVGTAESFVIVAGTSNRADNNGVIVRVKKIVKHESFSTSTNGKDVAIMIVEPPLPLNNINLAAIPLVTKQPVQGEMAIISGWGNTQQGGIPSIKLMEVSVPIIDNAICSAAYSPQDITDDMLCAGNLIEGGKDACQGDSGGPLIVNRKLAGVVSWGKGCALPGYPGLYANVYNLRNWIESAIKQNT